MSTKRAGKTCIVTGASSGIGGTIVKRLAGAKVAGNYASSKSGDSIVRLSCLLKRSGQQCEGNVTDAFPRF